LGAEGHESLSAKRLRARRICAALERRYGSPRLNNKDDPLDELVFILLSQMTAGPSYERVFDRFKGTLGTWEALLSMSSEEVRVLIADAGLSSQKAPRLIAIAKRLHEDFGAVTLSPLQVADDTSAESYLTSLPGVGRKTAKCVMMYAMGREVLPVDTHVMRVATRLGLFPPNVLGGDVHDHLEAVVRPAERYSFHVNAIAHGREICRARVPACKACPVSSSCPSATLSRSRPDEHL
jgi:endonuclease III